MHFATSYKTIRPTNHGRVMLQLSSLFTYRSYGFGISGGDRSWPTSGQVSESDERGDRAVQEAKTERKHNAHCVNIAFVWYISVVMEGFVGLFERMEENVKMLPECLPPEVCVISCLRNECVTDVSFCGCDRFTKSDRARHQICLHLSYVLEWAPRL